MLGGVISIAIAIWFYKTAESKGAPTFQWAFVGFVTYYLPNLIWTFWVAKPYVLQLHSQNAGFAATLVGQSGIFLGIAVAALVWFQVLRKLKSVNG
jgi:hypothetical protein